MKTLLIILCMILSVGCDESSQSKEINSTQDCNENHIKKSNAKANLRNRPESRLEAHIDNIVNSLEPHMENRDSRKFVETLFKYYGDNSQDLIQIFADILIDIIDEEDAKSRTDRLSEMTHYIFDVIEDNQDFMSRFSEGDRFSKRVNREIQNRYNSPEEWLSQFFDIKELEKLAEQIKQRSNQINAKFNLKSKNSSSEILINGDWCYPDCYDPMVAFKFQSSGSFNSTSKLMNIGYREGTWSDKGNNVVKLSYDDGTRTEIKIKSNTKFTIGSTIYVKQ